MLVCAEIETPRAALGVATPVERAAFRYAGCPLYPRPIGVWRDSPRLTTGYSYQVVGSTILVKCRLSRGKRGMPLHRGVAGTLRSEAYVVTNTPFPTTRKKPKKQVSLPVTLRDERLTSMEAREILREDGLGTLSRRLGQACSTKWGATKAFRFKGIVVFRCSVENVRRKVRGVEEKPAMVIQNP